MTLPQTETQSEVGLSHVAQLQAAEFQVEVPDDSLNIEFDDTLEDPFAEPLGNRIMGDEIGSLNSVQSMDGYVLLID